VPRRAVFGNIEDGLRDVVYSGTKRIQLPPLAAFDVGRSASSFLTFFFINLGKDLVDPSQLELPSSFLFGFLCGIRLKLLMEKW